MKNNSPQTEVLPLPIARVAEKLGVSSHDLLAYGQDKAKLPLHLINEEKMAQSHLILVSAINPTPPGEGKTTTSVGLAMGLNKLGKKATAVLREPSLGPVFGMKGGATGGGKSIVIPSDEINLHFTGDFSAVEKANNLLAAMIDNHLQKNELDIDPRTITWKRVMDMNDRSLRKIIIGLGGTGNGTPRETGFDITAASEVMAILCLARDMTDLKKRLGNIYVGQTYGKKPIFARDLNAVGAMATLLRDALMPNLVQTLEGTPAILHGGPFANIAQGTNSLLATRMGLSLSDYVVTEAGFGFDLGGEKFLNIKCGAGKLNPAVVVIVATIRALKYHGGVALENLERSDVAALARGMDNLLKHVQNARLFQLIPIVAINQFTSDTPEEIELLQDLCVQEGVQVSLSEAWAKGGEGALDLAQKVLAVCHRPEKSKLLPLYDWKDPVEKKIKTIAQKIYGASDVHFHEKARTDLKLIEKMQMQHFPICMAKTPYSFSDSPKLLGRPENFVITVREIQLAAGAELLIALTGDVIRMPGLPVRPAAEGMDIDHMGLITGLS